MEQTTSQNFQKIGLFPGQGSQVVGMGKDLIENFKVAALVYEEASESIKANIQKICIDGPPDLLQQTQWTQPCLLTTSVAAFRVLESEIGYSPDIVLGHSLGEYSALVAMRVFSIADASRWVHERGKAMQEAVPLGTGGMLAVLGGDDAQLDQLCKDAKESHPGTTLSPANYNSPGQTVLSGSQTAVDWAVAAIKAGAYPGLKGIPLAVSAPFHCALMKPARERMAQLFQDFLSKKTLGPLKAPYIPNVRPGLCRDSKVVFENLVEQVDQPVRFRQSIELLDTNLNPERVNWLEFGPGKVLQGLVKRTLKDSKTSTFSSISDTNGIRGNT